MIKNNYPGKFIVFEGLDGSGLTTQAELLCKFLTQKDYKVILTKEPTKNSKAGKLLRKILSQSYEVEPRKLQELFAKDRKEHLKKVIAPALKKGKIVICDRYCFSSFAYGQASDISFNWLFNLNKKFLMPDLIFILKVRPRICIARVKKRGKPVTLFEKERQLAKVWQYYKKLPKKFNNAYIINSEGSIREVFSKIRKMVVLKLM